MPIRDILWSNPVWFRTSLGDVQPLIQSIKERGLQVPILVTEDLLVLDGARRIVAYMSLGYKDIPVVVTNDWDKVVEHLEHTRAMEASGLPSEHMSWEDLDTVWRLGIIPLYEPKRQANIAAGAAKRWGKKQRTPSRQIPEPVNTGLSRAFATAMSTVKTLRDLFTAIRLLEGTHDLTDDQKKALRKIVHETESRNPPGKFSGLYGVRNLIRQLSNGTIPIDQITVLANPDNSAKQRIPDQVRAWEQNRRNNPPTESEVIANFCGVVSHFGEEAQRFQSFDSRLDAESLINQIRIAVNRFNALRRRLERGATTESEQDS